MLNFRKDTQAVLLPDHPKVVTTPHSIEPAYQQKLEDLLVDSEHVVLHLIIENNNKIKCYHQFVSRVEREFDEFKRKVWEKNIHEARKEAKDLINKLLRDYLLSDHLTEID